MTARLATLLLAAALGCSHDATPVVAPDDHPPLPESTPIGYLIDDAAELHLRDDQLGKLRDLDEALASHLDALDAGQRTPVPPSRPGPGGGGARGGGRRGGGGMGHRGGGGGGGGTSDPSSPAAVANAATTPATLPTEIGAGSAAPTGGPPPPPPAMKHHGDERAADTRAALIQALAVLDPDQQPVARKVLADHGVAVDAPAAPAAPEPAATPPRTSTP